MDVLAAVLVARSRRLPEKHLKEVYGGKRLIDVVVDNLLSMGLEVIVYSTYPFSISTTLILDESPWILPSIISLLKRLKRPLLIFGGDMPLVKKEAVEKILEFREHDIVVPRWKNGYLEPLHAYYSPAAIPSLEEELKSRRASLHGAIERCRDVYYLKAEDMDPHTFFNVNTPKDFEYLRKILES